MEWFLQPWIVICNELKRHSSSKKAHKERTFSFILKIHTNNSFMTYFIILNDLVLNPNAIEVYCITKILLALGWKFCLDAVNSGWGWKEIIEMYQFTKGRKSKKPPPKRIKHYPKSRKYIVFCTCINYRIGTFKRGELTFDFLWFLAFENMLLFKVLN